MIQLGPFQILEAERIQEVLQRAGVSYDFFVDEDLKNHILEDFNSRALTNPRGAAGSLDLRICFFNMELSDFSKVKDEMEKFGITAPSDGSWELGEDDSSV